MVAEKRYLLDQALDHELDALIRTLKHNLQITGYPIDCYEMEQQIDLLAEGTGFTSCSHMNIFKAPFDAY